MARYRAGQSNTEEFRRYLEKSGVYATLSDILVALYEMDDKPNNALDFIKLHLRPPGDQPTDAEILRFHLSDLKPKYNELMEENKELRNRLTILEAQPEEGAVE